MTRFVALVAIISASVGLQLVVMMKGWGLHPVSYGWIIGGGIFGMVAIHALYDVVMKESKK